MRTFLLGSVLGLAIGGLGVYLTNRSDSTETRSSRRSENATNRSYARDELDELERLRTLISKLEAELEAARKQAPADAVVNFDLPTTEAGIASLEREFAKMLDLDRLLALIEALLLQGEAGYPRLTRVILQVAMLGMSHQIKEEDMMERIVPAIQLAMRQERRIVGYVGYLITNDMVPTKLRTPALAAAMFLTMNGAKGSEEFGPKLLETFIAESEKGNDGSMFSGEQGRMLIEAMGMLKQGAAVDPLLRMLNDPAQARQSNRVIEALGRIGDPRAVGPLTQRLKANTGKSQWWSPPEVRALARIGTPEATAAAEAHVRSLEEDGQFFNQAGSFLRERSSPAMVAMISERFRKNPASSNLWSALRGLREANTPDARALLQEVATGSEQGQVRRQAQQHLDDLKEMDEQLKKGLAPGED